MPEIPPSSAPACPTRSTAITRASRVRSSTASIYVCTFRASPTRSCAKTAASARAWYGSGSWRRASGCARDLPERGGGATRSSPSRRCGATAVSRARRRRLQRRLCAVAACPRAGSTACCASRGPSRTSRPRTTSAPRISPSRCCCARRRDRGRPPDARYPARLRALEHPPDPLWIDGDTAALAARAVAIVGTRRMTTYGERVARELAGACASEGVVVVSGLAQGIDSAAHRGALDGGGRTVAVLGEGIVFFLATVRGRRRPLVPRIRANGALVSQYAPSFCAQPWMFVRRNATIAALAEAVVVVEAGEESGALITAEAARH